MKYEIINPSDKCYIYAEDVRLAKVACALLGGGWYGLKDEQGEAVMNVFEAIDESIGVPVDQLKEFTNGHAAELAVVFRSFEYAGERTSLNHIGKKAESYAVAFERIAEQ